MFVLTFVENCRKLHLLNLTASDKAFSQYCQNDTPHIYCFPPAVPAGARGGQRGALLHFSAWARCTMIYP